MEGSKFQFRIWAEYGVYLYFISIFDVAVDIDGTSFSALFGFVAQISLKLDFPLTDIEHAAAVQKRRWDAFALIGGYDPAYLTHVVRTAGVGEIHSRKALPYSDAATCIQVAAVLTLWPDLEAKQVEAPTMAHAVDLAEFYLNEALRLKDAAIISTETAKAERLRVWLMDKWQHPDIVPSEVVQSGPNSLRELKAAKGALKTLLEAGWLVQLDDGAEIRGSARKVAYKIIKPAL